MPAARRTARRANGGRCSRSRRGIPDHVPTPQNRYRAARIRPAARPDRSRTSVRTGYRRLVASNDWGDPLGFSSSVSALFFGRDEGFYYRTWGAELKGEKDSGIFTSWRLFGEQQFDATVHTEFSLAHPGGVKGDLTNIDAVNGKIVGLAVGHHSSIGLDPHGFRALTDIGVEGSTRGDGRRGAGRPRGRGGSRASRSSTPRRILPTADIPCGVHAAMFGSSISCTSRAPSGRCGPAPSTW